MKIHLTTISLTAVSLSLLCAQEGIERSDLDPVQAAIESFNNRDRSESTGSAATGSAALAEAEAPATAGKPVLVTGKPPVNSGLIDITEIPIDAQAAEILPPSEHEAKGLEVRVEQLTEGKGKFKPESVRLLAPFPAKPLDEAPEGWLLQSENNAPAFRHKIELSPGKFITLTVKPHVLAPDADQLRVLAISEPGFDASLGYAQSDTVSSALSDSIRKLNHDSKRIGSAIDQLQQLIISLPKPDPSAELGPAPIPSKPDGASSIPDANKPIPAQP